MFVLQKRKKGMTFIELIIVVAIVNILIVTSKPSYISYVQETHADNVKLQMFKMVTDLERIKGRYYSYEAAIDGDGNLITDSSLMRYPVNESEDKRFDLRITDLKFNEFKIEAIPTLNQGDYGTITLEQLTGDLEGHYYENDVLVDEWY